MTTNWSGLTDHNLPCIVLMKIPLRWHSALKQWNVPPWSLCCVQLSGKHSHFLHQKTFLCVALAVSVWLCLGLSLTSVNVKGWNCGWLGVTLERVRRGEPHRGKSSPLPFKGQEVLGKLCQWLEPLCVCYYLVPWTLSFLFLPPSKIHCHWF